MTALLLCLLLAACTAEVPSTYVEADALPPIYPDYTDVTVPVNIAPLTFELDDDVDEMVARYAFGDDEIICRDKMQPALKAWRRMTANACDSAISVDVYARRGTMWAHYRPFRIHVSPDSIDPWLSYRLIPPSYISFEALTISQRCLENYDERVIYDNMLCSTETNGQCINCHSFQQYDPQRFQFHARQNHGGTVIAYDGELRKLNLKTDSLLSSGVYPAWHPWLKLIAYSTDKTHQSFYTTHSNKIEVYDTESDLIAYDLENNEVMHIENSADELEVFPAWAPDGRTLYYCSAHYVPCDSVPGDSAATSASPSTTEIIHHVEDLHYNLYCKSFDPATKRFGPRELVFDADSLGCSAVLPRLSPDGRYLLFTLSAYGYFFVWHHDADLWLMDLETGATRPLAEVNSPDTESYHSWSSNGRWLVFSSRRDDGAFTRPFFAHITADGRASKPFELPSSDPDYHRQFMRCYNIPEFMRGPVTIKPQRFADILKGEATNVKYVQGNRNLN